MYHTDVLELDAFGNAWVMYWGAAYSQMLCEGLCGNLFSGAQYYLCSGVL